MYLSISASLITLQPRPPFLDTTPRLLRDLPCQHRRPSLWIEKEVYMNPAFLSETPKNASVLPV
jgi:hypothetical protein